MKFKLDIQSPYRVCLVLLSVVLLTASCSKPNKSETTYPDVDTSHPLDSGLPKKDYTYPDAAFDLTTILPTGHVTDGSVEYTEYLQAGIDANDIIVFPDFPILITTPGLRIRSGKQVYFREHSLLKMQGVASGNYYMVLLLDAENVTLKNLNLEGDRNRHLGTTGEWGMGIYISGCKNIVIDHAKITNCWGDGIILTKDGWNEPSDNVHIVNSLIDSCRRSGITIGSGHNILIEGTIMQNSNGPSISSGFTVEPNDRTHDVDNVTMRNCLTIGNERVGIRIVTSSLYGEGGALKENNMKFINHKDISSQFGLTFVLGSPHRSGGLVHSKLLFENIILQDNKTDAIANYTDKGAEVMYSVYFDKTYPLQGGKISPLRMKKIEAMIENTDYFYWK